MTQGERVKQVRKSLGLTMEKFGERLGVTKTAISLIESGKNNVTDANVKSICREFNVDYIWLATGDGEMFAHMSREELVADIVGKAIGSDNVTAQSAFIALGELDESEWDVIKKVVLRMAELLEE